MKNRIIYGTFLFALLIPSCNKNRINRETFNEVYFNDAKAVHTAMKEQQAKTFPNKGNTIIKYSIKATGDIRVEYMTFKNVNLNATATFKIAWSLDDKYIKLEGEKEKYYYINRDGKTYICQDYIINGSSLKRRQIVEEFDFKYNLCEFLDRYAFLNIPFVFSLGLGLTGTNRYITGVSDTEMYPDNLFDADTCKFFNHYKEYYKEEGKGYNCDIYYGSNDNNTVSAGVKGKFKAKDLTQGKREMGDINCDMFVSFKNNYLYQGEYIFKGNVLQDRINNLNLDFDLYLSQEIEQNKCHIDEINILDYMPE